MEKIAVIKTWTEYERGWRNRPDGVSIHLTKEDSEFYEKGYYDGMPDEAPDEYSQPSGGLKAIKLTDELYNEIDESEFGIRVYQHNLKDIAGKIEHVI